MGLVWLDQNADRRFPVRRLAAPAVCGGRRGAHVPVTASLPARGDRASFYMHTPASLRALGRVVQIAAQSSASPAHTSHRLSVT